jgi:hypothetical protein
MKAFFELPKMQLLSGGAGDGGFTEKLFFGC